MKRFLYFIRRVYRFLKVNGFKAAGNYVEKIATKIDVFKFYGYIVDETKVDFDNQAYQAHKDDEVKILNWVIPEMGVGSGGHINIFRFISKLGVPTSHGSLNYP